VSALISFPDILIEDAKREWGFSSGLDLIITLPVTQFRATLLSRSALSKPDVLRRGRYLQTMSTKQISEKRVIDSTPETIYFQQSPYCTTVICFSDRRKMKWE
jgi:hypothetical protein